MNATIQTNKKYGIAFTFPLDDREVKVSIGYDVNGEDAPQFINVTADYNENSNMGPGQGTNVTIRRTYYPNGTIIPNSILKPFGQEFEDIVQTVADGLFINNNFLNPDGFLATL